MSPKEGLIMKVYIKQTDTFNLPNKYIVHYNCDIHKMIDYKMYWHSCKFSVLWLCGGVMVCHLRGMGGEYVHAFWVTSCLCVKPHLQRASTMQCWRPASGLNGHPAHVTGFIGGSQLPKVLAGALAAEGFISVCPRVWPAHPIPSLCPQSPLFRASPFWSLCRISPGHSPLP